MGYAARQQLQRVLVVDDSNLIISQLRERHAPRARHLNGLYAQWHMLAGGILMISSWTHHLRDFNKMADGLANLTMDTKTSKQVSNADIPRLSPRWTAVTKFLQGL